MKSGPIERKSARLPAADMRLVIDTNLVISGLLWNGAPRRLIELALNGKVELFTSEHLLKELSGVLARDKFEKRMAQTRKTQAMLMHEYGALYSVVVPAPLQPIAPDPDDDWVIATAIAAKADLIVTGDKPFLGVGQVGDIRIVTVAQALALLADA